MMVRNSSEELIIRSLIDGSTTANGATTFDTGGFLQHRVNSEELFNSWIANSETGFARTPQASRKKSTELAALLAQQQAIEHYQIEHGKSRGAPDYPSLQTLSWFQYSQPMTRSRSTELRRRYMEIQKQPDSCLGRPMEQSFLPWPDNLPQPDVHQKQPADHISSVSTVVNMLKGSLEKKRMSRNLISQQQEPNNVDSSYLFRMGTPSESSGANDNSCPPTPNQIHLFHDQQAGRAILFSGSGDGQADDQYKQKQPQLSRAGSVTSSGRSGLEATDVSTKKRRVERKRMMVEAKGRSSVPAIPADMQAAIKRAEALEKEVRSLKLNLSFMNRKDSEQTKRIEELEKQNEELLREKCRLSEELDQLISTRTSW